MTSDEVGREIFWKTPRGPPLLIRGSFSTWPERLYLVGGWTTRCHQPIKNGGQGLPSYVYIYIYIYYIWRGSDPSRYRDLHFIQRQSSAGRFLTIIYLCSWNFVGFWVGVRIGCLFGPVGFLVSLVKPFITLEVCPLCAFCTPSRARWECQSHKANQSEALLLYPSSVGWKFKKSVDES